MECKELLELWVCLCHLSRHTLHKICQRACAPPLALLLSCEISDVTGLWTGTPCRVHGQVGASLCTPQGNGLLRPLQYYFFWSVPMGSTLQIHFTPEMYCDVPRPNNRPGGVWCQFCYLGIDAKNHPFKFSKHTMCCKKRPSSGRIRSSVQGSA